MKPPRLAALAAIALALAAILAVVYWPRPEPIPGERLDAEQIRALPAEAVVDRLAARLAERAGSRLDGWRSLPAACRHVYAVRACETSLAKYRLADHAAACLAFPAAPSPGEEADAFRAIGAAEVGGILDEVAGADRTAIEAWADRTRQGATVAASDPLTGQDARLRAALAKAGIPGLLAAFIHQHADELADP